MSLSSTPASETKRIGNRKGKLLISNQPPYFKPSGRHKRTKGIRFATDDDSSSFSDSISSSSSLSSQEVNVDLPESKLPGHLSPWSSITSPSIHFKSTSSSSHPQKKSSKSQSKKLIPLLWSCRAFLDERNWSGLKSGLMELDGSLMAMWKKDAKERVLDVLTPILARLVISLDFFLESSHSEFTAKDYRKGLDSNEARSLNTLSQRWPKMRETHFWKFVYGSVVASAPTGFVDANNLMLNMLFSSLEANLLHLEFDPAPETPHRKGKGSPPISTFSKPRSRKEREVTMFNVDHNENPTSSSKQFVATLMVAGLGLDDPGFIQILNRLQGVVEWYLSWVPEARRLRDSGWVLGRIKHLDLRWNSLCTFPESLSLLLPNLTFISCDSNLFPLPPHVVFFKKLQAINILDNSIHRKREKAALISTKARLERLGFDFEPSSGNRNRPPPWRVNKWKAFDERGINGERLGNVDNENCLGTIRWPNDVDTKVERLTVLCARLLQRHPHIWEHLGKPTSLSSLQLSPSSSTQSFEERNGTDDPQTSCSEETLASTSSTSFSRSNISPLASYSQEVPEHILLALKRGYDCVSCGYFVSPSPSIQGRCSDRLPNSPSSSPLYVDEVAVEGITEQVYKVPGITLNRLHATFCSAMKAKNGATYSRINSELQSLVGRNKSQEQPLPPIGDSNRDYLSTWDLKAFSLWCKHSLQVMIKKHQIQLTYVIGGKGWKFCRQCLDGHLGGSSVDRKDTNGRTNPICICVLCEQEREVIGQTWEDSLDDTDVVWFKNLEFV